MNNPTAISLVGSCDPDLARLVRMTAANGATLSSMSVACVEAIRMAAEAALSDAGAPSPDETLTIDFDVDSTRVAMSFTLEADVFADPSADDPTAAYADLILGSVCDVYQKVESPARLVLEVKADVDDL